MLSFTEAAERLVEDGVTESMTAEGLRRLARDPLSGWPIGPDDYRVVGKTRMLPYELLVPYMQTRKRARGPAKQPRKKRHVPHKQQGDPVSATVDPRIAILSALNDPPYNQTAEKRCVPWGEAEKMLNAYRASVVDEVVTALREKAGELSAEAEEEMRRDLEGKAQEWYSAAEVAEKLKTKRPEPQDG